MSRACVWALRDNRQATQQMLGSLSCGLVSFAARASQVPDNQAQNGENQYAKNPEDFLYRVSRALDNLDDGVDVGDEDQ